MLPCSNNDGLGTSDAAKEGYSIVSIPAADKDATLAAISEAVLLSATSDEIALIAVPNAKVGLIKK